MANDSAAKSAPLKAGIAIGCFVALIGLVWFFSENFYLWAKSFHLIAMISWMVGLFYLPRLFVYHASVELGSESASLFELMEMRLMKIIMTPAMIITWGFGLYLIGFIGSFPIWLAIKLVLVLLLTLFHFYLAGAVKRMKAKPDLKTPGQWRLYNEIPTILMILIVILAVVKPF